MSPNSDPHTIDSVESLENLLSEPDEGVLETLGRTHGDLIVLGAGGKMGPTLARMARRAMKASGNSGKVIAVSRFSRPGVEASLQRHGVTTIQCDLLDSGQVDGLPKAPNVVYMTGMKFGTTGNEGATWAMNTYAPALACRRYQESRIVAFSTGNVYGMTTVDSAGSLETDRLEPDGEYAMSCLGRERILDYCSRAFDIPMSIIRLNYACEPRYGVLVDIGTWVWRGQPVPLETGFVNVIWQRDANAVTLRMFDDSASPPSILNAAGPETLHVREVANSFAELMGKPARFTGTECDTAYLSDSAEMCRRFGPPRTDASQMIEYIADWLMRGGEALNRPTHFEVRSGKF